MASHNPNMLKNVLPGAGTSFSVDGATEIGYRSIDTDCIALASIGTAQLTPGSIVIGPGAVQTSNIAAGAVTSAVTAANLIQTISVPLAQTDITGMYAAPKQIIAAVSGKSIFIVCAVVRYVYGVHAFTAGGVIDLQYGNTVNGAGTTPLTTAAASVILATSSSDTQLQQAATTTTVPQATGIFLSNATQAFAIAGGATSAVTLIVQYYVV